MGEHPSGTWVNKTSHRYVEYEPPRDRARELAQWRFEFKFPIRKKNAFDVSYFCKFRISQWYIFYFVQSEGCSDSLVKPQTDYRRGLKLIGYFDAPSQLKIFFKPSRRKVAAKLQRKRGRLHNLHPPTVGAARPVIGDCRHEEKNGSTEVALGTPRPFAIGKEKFCSNTAAAFAILSKRLLVCKSFVCIVTVQSRFRCDND